VALGVAATAMAVVAFAVGLHWAPSASPPRMRCSISWCERHSCSSSSGDAPVSTRDLLGLLVQPWACAAAVALALFALRYFAPPGLGAGLGSAIAAALTLGLTATVTWSTPVGRRSVRDLAALLRRQKVA